MIQKAKIFQDEHFPLKLETGDKSRYDTVAKLVVQGIKMTLVYAAIYWTRYPLNCVATFSRTPHTSSKLSVLGGEIFGLV